MYRRIRDLEVYCEIVGEGKPVVMVHGMGVDHRTMKGCMEPVFQHRRDKWQRIYFDLPGMGSTKGVDWITNSDDMFEFVLAVVDEVIPGEPFLIVGESYGGYLVRAIVRQRPNDVEGMLLICPLVVADDEQRDVPPCSVLLMNNYPRSGFVVLDMAGHGLQIEQAVSFNALVNEWLDRVKGS